MNDYHYLRALYGIATELIDAGAPREAIGEFLETPVEAIPAEKIPDHLRRLKILRQDILQHPKARLVDKTQWLNAVGIRERALKRRQLQAAVAPGMTASVSRMVKDPKLLEWLRAQDIDIERSKPLSALLMDVRDLLKIVDGHETVADEIREAWRNELARISLNLKRILARTGAGG